MLQKIVKGYEINFEEDAVKGVDHLAYILSYEESGSLFQAARLAGHTDFEDRGGRNFILVHNPNGSFELKVRNE
ncbi:MAG: hypothetical protein PHE59_04180 [Patescibacteria group bacterium]|nr:hypothetical protein [Patescibacteria group bacterium]MDD5164889.1 hypothetical protein [Patescibacteria group bacterium]MDD5534404.1 hypothetical protein [Patescibacteria group bacterium]